MILRKRNQLIFFKSISTVDVMNNFLYNWFFLFFSFFFFFLFFYPIFTWYSWKLWFCLLFKEYNIEYFFFKQFLFLKHFYLRKFFIKQIGTSISCKNYWSIKLKIAWRWIINIIVVWKHLFFSFLFFNCITKIYLLENLTRPTIFCFYLTFA